MSPFTPISGLLGGSIIGAASSILLLGNGDIMGASGLVSSFIVTPNKTLKDPSQSWKVIFLSSFFLTAIAWTHFTERKGLVDPVLAINPNVPAVSALGHLVSGLLVGFGTRLSNGCTTGHGVAGLARFSKRSAVAVLVFMSSGILAATVCNPDCPPAKYLRAGKDFLPQLLPTQESTITASFITTAFLAISITKFLNIIFKSIDSYAVPVEEKNNNKKIIPAIISGSLFAVGLAISQMIWGSKIYGFLDFTGFARGSYDPTLISVMGGALIFSFLAYQFVDGFNVSKLFKRLKSPLSQTKGSFNVPTNMTIDGNLVFGALVFGLGWGIGGLCPGPAIYLAAAGFPQVLFRWWPGFFIGVMIAEKVKNYQR